MESGCDAMPSTVDFEETFGQTCPLSFTPLEVFYGQAIMPRCWRSFWRSPSANPLSSHHRSIDRWVPTHCVALSPAPNYKFSGLACYRCYDRLLLWALLDCSSVLVLRLRFPP